LKDLQSGSLYKYLKSPGVYRCPFDPPPYNLGLGAVRPITSYGMNGSVNAYGATSPKVPFFRIDAFRGNDILVWECDETVNRFFYFNDGANFPYEGITRRHGGKSRRNEKSTESSAGAIISNADLSVEWITVKAYYDEEKKQGRNRLYNIPKGYNVNGGH
jgi:hypothetical protein